MQILRFINDQGTIQFAEFRGNASPPLLLEGNLYEGFRTTGHPVTVAKLLAPVVPTAVLCIGLNYRRHAQESNQPIPAQPVVFSKPVSALQDPDGPIELPRALRSDEVDYECELAVIIGRKCKNVTRDKALSYVAGYTCANDVSARDWQLKWGGGQWCRSKSFDTFLPLGPVVSTPQTIPDPSRLRISTRLNGQYVQDCTTEDMIFDVPAIIEFLSGSSTLLPGTVILTGTPHGVGMASRPPRYLRPGDRVVIEIEKIGQLENPVIEEPVMCS